MKNSFCIALAFVSTAAIADGYCIYTYDQQMKIIKQDCKGIFMPLNADERQALVAGRARSCVLETTSQPINAMQSKVDTRRECKP